jgi:hypothetical protein
MAHTFALNIESLKRKYSVYVVVARGLDNSKLYVGKTGDNNEGCNPVISRCGNHFSYNKTHSQLRNKIDDHETREYTYIFDHFDDYPENLAARRDCIEKINEIERWVNVKIQALIKTHENLVLLNAFAAAGNVNKMERDKRAAHHTPANARKVEGILDAVRDLLGIPGLPSVK